MILIPSPGKFEGCYPFVPHFWNMTLEHFDDMWIDDDNYTHYIIYFIDEDYFHFSIPANYVKIDMWEDNNGFVYGVLLS